MEKCNHGADAKAYPALAGPVGRGLRIFWRWCEDRTGRSVWQICRFFGTYPEGDYRHRDSVSPSVRMPRLRLSVKVVIVCAALYAAGLAVYLSWSNKTGKCAAVRTVQAFLEPAAERVDTDCLESTSPTDKAVGILSGHSSDVKLTGISSKPPSDGNVTEYHSADNTGDVGTQGDVQKQRNGASDVVTNGSISTQSAVFIDIDAWMPESDALFRRLVVVTAFSQNHYKEALGMISSAQRVMPDTRIVAYDIGIKEKYRPKVKALCNVELRPFQFHKYPPFVSNLRTYSWKVIIIKESLNEFGAIFWADASVRFKKSLRVLVPFALEHHGYLARIHSYSAQRKSPVRHNYYFTHDLMYKAIGVDKEEYSRSNYAPHPTANRQLVINSSTVQQNYLRPLYACTLDENCISPPGSKYGEHRYDASALMLVIHKYFPGEFSRRNDHLKDWDDVMYMHRMRDDWTKARNCFT